MKNSILKFYIYLLSKWIFKIRNLQYTIWAVRQIYAKKPLWIRDKNSYEWTQTFSKYLVNVNLVNNFLRWFDSDSNKIWVLMLDKISEILYNNVLEYNKIITEEESNEQKEFSKQYFKSINEFNFPLNEISSYLNIFYIPKLIDIIPGLEAKLSNKDIIDAGAYIWDSSIIFSKTFKNLNKIFALEPLKENYNKLKYYINTNNVTNIVAINKWVWEITWVVYMDKWWAWSKISKNWSEKIEIISIDELVKENSMSPWLIKWDIEWFEFESILGTLQTIKEHRPILLISIYHRGKDFFEIKTLIESLDLWYQFKLTRWNCFHPFADLLLVCY